MAADQFVPVAGDDWYQRRRQDEEGEFFRRVSNQAGRGSDAAEGGDSRQGIYIFTASGKLIVWKNIGQLRGETADMLRQALNAWDTLPKTERAPGAVKLGELVADQRFTRVLPAGGLALRTFTRALTHDRSTGFRVAEIETYGARTGPQHDHVWLTASEWHALVPADVRVGSVIAVPDAVVLRFARYHLVDSTGGEPSFWEPEHVRSAAMTLTVEKVADGRVRLRLNGRALLATAADVAKADRGYDVELLGNLDYNSTSHRLERFDALALGRAWGGNPHWGSTNDQNRGTHLAVAIELASGSEAADTVPPAGARWDDYFARPTQR